MSAVDLDWDSLPFFYPLKSGMIITKSGLFLDLGAATSALLAYSTLLKMGPDAPWPPWTNYAECRQRHIELSASIAVIKSLGDSA